MTKAKLVPGEWGSLATEQPRTPEQIEAKAQELLGQMTLEEKIKHMSGDSPYFPGLISLQIAYNREPLPAGENLRLGIPGIRFTDGPRGVVMYHSTCFPVSMCRGASWDVELEERVGGAIGVEARAQGANLFAGVCINLLRHPAWGRAQETYGEDPYHLGEMGAALIRGVQRHVMGCVKHFAANSMENARFKVDVHMSERTLREVYLPHFKRCIDEGAAAVMSAYNKLNGEHCGHHAHLLKEILKVEWGFQGFVMSDFVFGIRDGKAAALSGMDLEMPFTQHYGKKLHHLVQAGQVPVEVIDAAVLRLLRQKLRFAQVGEKGRYSKEAVASAEHRALAHEVAVKSIVLLKNELLSEEKQPLLPLDATKIKSLAVIGRLAWAENTGDAGSSQVRPPSVVTPMAAIWEALEPGAQMNYDSGKDPTRAAQIARQAEAAILIVGYTPKEEGEFLMWRGGDRRFLTLPPNDESLIKAVARANPRCVVVMIGGGPIITEAWRLQVPAILMAWYPGMEGGRALADVLFGRENPSAKLPCTFPCSESQLPFFDRDADSIDYDYFHGYRLLDKEGKEPAFPFGFGLSYTSFGYASLRVDPGIITPQGAIQVNVDVTNTGARSGAEIVQLYIGCPGKAVERPLKELKGFQKVFLQPGETATLHFPLPAPRLAYYDESAQAWIVEPGQYRVFVGGSSRESDLLGKSFLIN